MRPHVTDFFGEVPVSFADVRAWLLAVPRLDPQSPRAPAYVRDWGVVEKIKRAKLDGSFDKIVRRNEREDRWWHRFHW